MKQKIKEMLNKKAIVVANPHQEKIFRSMCKTGDIIVQKRPSKNKEYPTYYVFLGKVENLTAYENEYLDGPSSSVIKSGFTPMSLNYFKNVVEEKSDKNEEI